MAETTSNGSIRQRSSDYDDITNESIKELGPSKGLEQAGVIKDTQRLGNYRAALVPVLAYCFELTLAYFTIQDYSFDERARGWFLLERPLLLVFIGFLYIFLSTVWGPRWMVGKKPEDYKKTLIFYNAFQVVISFYMFIELCRHGWMTHYSYRCQSCDYSATDPAAVGMSHVAHWFFLSKILDLADTAFFVARGKFAQVTQLHVVHHSCMLICTWFASAYTPGGQISFLAFLNTFVHTVMYSYYLLAAMGPRVRPFLWWKKYLTQLQLTQFVLIFLHMAQLTFTTCSGVSKRLVVWTLCYAVLFFSLFSNFYFQSYKKNRKPKAKVEDLDEKNNNHSSEKPTVSRSEVGRLG